MDLTPPTLAGRHVRLVPLTIDHVPALWEVASEEDIWRWTLNQMRSEADVRRYVLAALETQAAGGAIPFASIATIRDAVDAETIAFDWRAGDVLLIDNVLVAHGRRAYSGSRRVLAALIRDRA